MFTSLLGKFNKSTPAPQTASNEVEEDGFLLVGQTASDRKAIHTNQFDARISSPPQYSNVEGNQEENLPSYQDYMTSMTCDNSRREQQNTIYSSATMSRYLSPLSGVQFQLAHQLQPTVSSDFPWDFFAHSHFDLSKYEYDFSFERSILRDMTIAEEASGPVSSENLIQF